MPLAVYHVLEALPRVLNSGLPWEMLYADDLVIIRESLTELEERYLIWKKQHREQSSESQYRKDKDNEM